MSLETTLENLRAKPEHVRRRIAFLSSLGITLIIFVFWLASFTGHVSKDSVKNSVASALVSVNTPAQNLLASVGSFAGSIRDLVFGPRKVTFSTIEVRAGNK